MPIDLGSLNLAPEWSKNTPASQLPPKKDKPQKQPSPTKGDGIVRVGRETKGRKGSGVTVITGIQSHPEGLEKLAKQFKQQCGTGGTFKNGVIEIQGDHRDLLVAELQKLGYTVKRSGG
jgi:translation initiation factor 1